MAQATYQIRSSPATVSPARAALTAFVCLCASTLFAQPQPYLLLQAPRSRATERFAIGTVLEWRFVGEDELFSAPFRGAFPESQSVLISDILIGVDKIAEVRYKHENRFQAYTRVQGPLIAIISGIGLAVPSLRQRQGNFLVGTATTGVLLTLFGNIGRYRRREVGPTKAWQLHVAGGDLREADDPERY